MDKKRYRVYETMVPRIVVILTLTKKQVIRIQKC